MNITIREARLEDYDAVDDLMREIHALHVGELPHIFRMPEGNVQPWTYFNGTIHDDEAIILVAEEAGKLVGLVDIRLRLSANVSTVVPKLRAVVDTIVVTASHQRKGLGRALMARAEQWASEQNCTDLILNVWAFNEEAIAFYRSLGYAIMLNRMEKHL